MIEGHVLSDDPIDQEAAGLLERPYRALGYGAEDAVSQNFVVTVLSEEVVGATDRLDREKDRELVALDSGGPRQCHSPTAFLASPPNRSPGHP